MKAGARSYGGASCRVSVPHSLPDHMQARTREISGVLTDPANRRKGNASELLRRLVLEADHDSIVLMLSPKPEDDEPLDLQALVNWYHKYAFQLIQNDPPLMARSPRH